MIDAPDLPELDEARPGIWVCPACDHIEQAARCPGPCPRCVQRMEDGEDTNIERTDAP